MFSTISAVNVNLGFNNNNNNSRQKVINYRMCFLSLALAIVNLINLLIHVRITSGSRHGSSL